LSLYIVRTEAFLFIQEIESWVGRFNRVETWIGACVFDSCCGTNVSI